MRVIRFLCVSGGTIDITVHEVQYDDTLKEIHKANGGDWGGTKVDQEFQHLVSNIVGKKAFDSFATKHKADMIELLRDFETKKRTIKPSPDPDEKINYKIPMALNMCCKVENKGKDIAAIIQSREEFKGILSVTGDTIRANAEYAKEVFKDSTQQIVKHMKKLIRDPEVAGIQTILMVGGFSESPVLQGAIRENFPKLRVIVPPEAGLAVLKGAVLFGHEPFYIYDLSYI